MSFLDKFIGFFQKEKPAEEIFILVRNHINLGIVTHCDSTAIRQFNSAQKKQLTAFLEGIIEELK